MPSPATPFAILTTPQTGAARAPAPAEDVATGDAAGFEALLGEETAQQAAQSTDAEPGRPGGEAETGPARKAGTVAESPDAPADIEAAPVQQPIAPQARSLGAPAADAVTPAPADAADQSEAPRAPQTGEDAAAQQRFAAQAADETGALREAVRSDASASAAPNGAGAPAAAEAAASAADPADTPNTDMAPAANPVAKPGGAPKAEPQATPPKSSAPASAPAQPISAPASDPVESPDMAPAQTDKAAKPAPADGESILRDGRAASERAPGDMLRAAIKPEAGKATGGSTADGPARTVVDGKTAAAHTAPSGAAPAAPAASASPANPAAAFIQAPIFDLSLSPLAAQILGDAGAGELTLDPALTKTESGLDPAALRLDARTEMRSASTLQFAQGPRFTPHSAQTLAAQIAQRFSDGARVFDIRLDPPELGRVEVRLEVGSDNSVRAVLAAERTETLAELQRSARDLERALAEAGLELGENALSFSLTDDGAPGESEADGFSGAAPVFSESDALEAGDALAAPVASYGFLLARAERLDVSV